MFYQIAYALVTSVYRLLFRVRVQGRENIPKGPCVVCADHTSSSDPVFVAIALTRKNQPFFMAKIELLKTPVLGFLFKKLGVFAVDRGNSDIKSIKHAMSLLKSGRKIMIFPEGTRVDVDTEIQAKAGAIMLSQRTQSPILPIYVRPGRKRLFSKVSLVIGQSFHPATLSRRPTPEESRELATDLMRRIYSLRPEPSPITHG